MSKLPSVEVSAYYAYTRQDQKWSYICVLNNQGRMIAWFASYEGFEKWCDKYEAITNSLGIRLLYKRFHTDVGTNWRPNVGVPQDLFDGVFG